MILIRKLLCVVEYVFHAIYAQSGSPHTVSWAHTLPSSPSEAFTIQFQYTSLSLYSSLSGRYWILNKLSSCVLSHLCSHPPQSHRNKTNPYFLSDNTHHETHTQSFYGNNNSTGFVLLLLICFRRSTVCWSFCSLKKQPCCCFSYPGPREFLYYCFCNLCKFPNVDWSKRRRDCFVFFDSLVGRVEMSQKRQQPEEGTSFDERRPRKSPSFKR